MGNGMPISALLGRQEIMKEFEDVFFSSTFGGETLSLAAAIATIEKLDRTKAIEKINALGSSLNSKVDELIVKHNLSDALCLSGLPQWTRLQIKDQSPQVNETIKTFLIESMIENGILYQCTHNITWSLTDEDISNIVDAYDNTFDKLQRHLRLNTLSQALKGKTIKPIFAVRS